MSKRCRFILYSIIGIGVLCLILLLAGFVYYTGLIIPYIGLQGKKELTMEVNTKFIDPGIRACYKFHDFSDKVIKSTNLDTNKIGIYHIKYSLPDIKKEVKRTVHIVDTKEPKIVLDGNKVSRIFLNNKYEEEGFSAIDNYDGNVTNKVEIINNVNINKTGKYKIQYNVKDSSGNSCTAERKIEVCEDPTNVKLYYNYNQYDNHPEEWWFEKSKNHERTNGAIKEDILKKYHAYYQGENKKVLYLTFDEGGNDITYIKQIANILDKYQIKATFFLTRNYIKNEAEFINKLVANGHIIGNHTWHHYDMTTLANEISVDQFTKELTETEKTYMEVVGQPMTKVFRFPKGGASERAIKMVSDLGYSTFFWSHAYYDYANDVTKDEALRSMLNYYHPGAIYLLHPSNKGNYEAMEDFIQEMIKKGYHFDTVNHIQ